MNMILNFAFEYIGSTRYAKNTKNNQLKIRILFFKIFLLYNTCIFMLEDDNKLPCLRSAS